MVDCARCEWQVGLLQELEACAIRPSLVCDDLVPFGYLLVPARPRHQAGKRGEVIEALRLQCIARTTAWCRVRTRLHPLVPASDLAPSSMDELRGTVQLISGICAALGGGIIAWREVIERAGGIKAIIDRLLRHFGLKA